MSLEGPFPPSAPPTVRAPDKAACRPFAKASSEQSSPRVPGLRAAAAVPAGSCRGCQGARAAALLTRQLRQQSPVLHCEPAVSVQELQQSPPCAAHSCGHRHGQGSLGRAGQGSLGRAAEPSGPRVGAGCTQLCGTRGCFPPAMQEGLAACGAKRSLPGGHSRGPAEGQALLSSFHGFVLHNPLPTAPHPSEPVWSCPCRAKQGRERSGVVNPLAQDPNSPALLPRAVQGSAQASRAQLPRASPRHSPLCCHSHTPLHLPQSHCHTLGGPEAVEQEQKSRGRAQPGSSASACCALPTLHCESKRQGSGFLTPGTGCRRAGSRLKPVGQTLLAREVLQYQLPAAVS